MHIFLAFRPIWLAISISGSSFWLVDTYFFIYFSKLPKSGCQNLKLAGITFPLFPSFWSSVNKIKLSLSNLGNSLDQLTSQGIRNCKICFKLPKAVIQRPTWCQDPPLYILKLQASTLFILTSPSMHFVNAIQSILLCKKGRVQLSEMRAGHKKGLPPGFLCHTD